MKFYLILITIFILALLQGAFLPLNLLLLAIFLWAIIKPPKEALLIAFLAGIFLDLSKGTPLGFSSLLYLIFSFIALLYSRRFDPSHPVFLAIFVFFFSLVFNLILKKPWLAEGITLAVFSVILRPLIKNFSGGFNRGELKLKI